ncbi:MAG: hypothetical protein PUF12_12640 [Thermoflexaceae bacterium]|nr:hypothetical protein [Thermoflexaceae bacterium]
MNLDEDWLIILHKYSEIKRVYIECEETDPELKTNLQPLNEFRAALDHIMKMETALYLDNNEEEYLKQKEKLISHLNRAFYDICDMLSINYRNKIIDIVELYDVETIRTAIPDYYSVKRGIVEEISQRIGKYRNEKGGYSVDNVDRFQEYSADVLQLKDIYIEILGKQGALEEVKKKSQKERKREQYKDLILGGIIGIIGSVLVTIFFGLF